MYIILLVGYSTCLVAMGSLEAVLFICYVKLGKGYDDRFFYHGCQLYG